MSTLWTPQGERPIKRDPGPAPAEPPPGEPPAGPGQLSEEELARRIHEEEERLAAVPVENVVAGLAIELARVAAVHLSRQPPQLEKARTAIDAFGALVEGMAGRLGEPESELVQMLGHLRMDFVSVRTASASSG